MIIEIKNRWTGAVLFSVEAETLHQAVEAALAQGANLYGANLYGANLYGANLRSANLRSANLEGANLEGANLRSANLEGANLDGANLEGANLEGANLEGANLRSANLRSANLRSANLEGANLRSANLYGALNAAHALADYREDIRKVLDSAPSEVPGLLQALWDGKVDGTTYHGECACLVGTIANVRRCSYDAIPELKPDSSRPAEQWFLNIRKGDTPVTNPASAFACAVVAEWMHERGISAPVRR